LGWVRVGLGWIGTQQIEVLDHAISYLHRNGLGIVCWRHKTKKSLGFHPGSPNVVVFDPDSEQSQQ
jgi:hypothetical protein